MSKRIAMGKMGNKTDRKREGFKGVTYTNVDTGIHK